ncbi:IS3 family transposase [Peredibacter starrii]|uniref:IS3 family transposase n=1 Tax=Peredibacter starrii TaxID=28202 RepID=A0AAX4HV03_9BACT|nr:IS3 family transposase [Peredibacter starrii]WPU67219.1 IS3 family transposase [Peredibacter starrii]
MSKDPSLNRSYLCRLMSVSRSGFYSSRKSSEARQERDRMACKIIKHYHERSRKKAGIITLDLLMRRDGHVINHKKIARIKREYGFETKIRRRNPYRAIPLKSGEHVEIPNLLKRDFYPPLPDQVYSTDMTYLYYGNCDKAFLSATKDLATNEIVSYKLMKTPTVSAFACEFKELLSKIPIEKRTDLMIHSDQGFQYTNEEFRAVLRLAGVTQSMSRRGNCLDNAPIESFFGHFKDLLEIKKCRSYEEVEKVVSSTIKYYNEERPQKGLNKKPPAEYRGLLLSGFF